MHAFPPPRNHNHNLYSMLLMLLRFSPSPIHPSLRPRPRPRPRSRLKPNPNPNSILLWRSPPHLRLRCSPPSPTPSDGLAASSDEFYEELGRLLVLLPQEMQRRLEAHPELPGLIEVVMDLGRRPLVRFPSGDLALSDRPISSHDLHHAASQVGDFASDNRAGISRTLHRISAIRNRKGGVVGLTCQVGRAVPGSANMLRDLVKDGGSLLLIGPPGVGKTTIIRDIARMLADDYKKRVMIVDTSNEIGGDGDIPHAGIDSACRLQVPNSDMQHKVLIEAVENHMPQVIVIDEIGTKLEAMAASTIAQRGIQLVATAHGVTIENLIMNPSLDMLVGGIQITETSVLQVIKQLGMDEAIALTDNISEADAFLALHSKLKKNSQIQAVAKSRGIPVHVTKTSSLMQITKAIHALTNEHVKNFKEIEVENKMSSLETKDALEEARLAIEQAVIPKGEKVQLLPRPSHVISRQIELIESYKFKWEKVGREPHFSLCIHPIPLDVEDKRSPDQVVDTESDLEDIFSFDDMNSSQRVLLDCLSFLNK